MWGQVAQSTSNNPAGAFARRDLIKSIKTFQNPSNFYSSFQVVSTVGLLLLSYAVLIGGIRTGHWLVLLLSPVAAGLAVRSFVLQHDCGHGSFFRSRKVNTIVGRGLSLLTFTPYDHWRRHHNIHHGSWNNLSHRGRLSDMYSDCITVAEYHDMSHLQKFLYAASKHPVISLLLMPPVIFFIVYRVPFDAPGRGWRKERRNLHLTSLGIGLLYGGTAWAFGVVPVAVAMAAVIYPASVAGVWLFLVQHKFEGARWDADPNWDAFEASLYGCSFLRLPKLFAWFSGNIGYHHVHHAAPGIPNYRLKDCHHAHELLQGVKTVRPAEGFREIGRHELWDEDSRVMVKFRIARKLKPRVV